MKKLGILFLGHIALQVSRVLLWRNTLKRFEDYTELLSLCHHLNIFCQDFPKHIAHFLNQSRELNYAQKKSGGKEDLVTKITKENSFEVSRVGSCLDGIFLQLHNHSGEGCVGVLVCILEGGWVKVLDWASDIYRVRLRVCSKRL